MQTHNYRGEEYHIPAFELILNGVSRVNFSTGEVVELTDGNPRENKLEPRLLILLNYLLSNVSKEFISYEDIYADIYNTTDTGNLKTDIHYLRVGIFDKQLSAKKYLVIQTVRGNGYRVVLPEGSYVRKINEASAWQELGIALNKAVKLPRILTKDNSAAFFDVEEVIHRDELVKTIEEKLDSGKSTILLSGFGGVGKTALARKLYHRQLLKGHYDSCGWVEYSGSIKESLLRSIAFAEDITDQNKRWEYIRGMLKDDGTKIFLVIDNVSPPQQNEPYAPEQWLEELYELSAWPNVSIILTSRIEEIFGYSYVSVKELGDKNRPLPCVDLFYFYYNQTLYKNREKYDNWVYYIVEWAGYHTYTIELLARSARKYDSLADFYRTIEEKGLSFSNSSFRTKYDKKNADIVVHLKTLFDMSQRNSYEQQTLWDFSVLPEGACLSPNEVLTILDYGENDFQSLCDERWILFSGGRGYYIHPLVREIVHFDLVDGRAPHGTAKRLCDLVNNKQLIPADLPQTSVLKRLTYAESAANFINFEHKANSIDYYFNLGMMEYVYARKRLTAVEFIRKAIDIALSYEPSIEKTFLAKMYYQLGYIESTSHKYRANSADDLRTALSLWEQCADSKHNVAMANDHLGYVLSDNPETYGEAEACLRAAMKYHKEVYLKSSADDAKYHYSTTLDNLGCLLAKLDMQKKKEGAGLLLEAMNIREELYKSSEKYASDVAWTAYNLGCLIGTVGVDHSSVAKGYFERSLSIRRDLEKKYPGRYTTNIVFTLISYAKYLSADPQNINVVRGLIEQAVEMKKKISNENMGFFSDEIERKINELVSHVHKTK